MAVLSPDANPGEQIPLDLETLLDALGIDVLAVDMFLKIDGIEGESTAAGGHADWIEVESFSWGASRPSTSTGRTRGGGRTSFSDVSVVKKIDAASPNLYLACASGKRYPSATLQIRKAGEGPMLYMEYRLEDVRISSVSVSHSAGHDEPVEEVTLSYGKIVWTYTPADATRQGGGVEKSWNLEANQEG
ncbi:MAG: type VI secretion system tube protein Hcp [Gemmatimonadetes bacterium]|nr:type VI secretion system tube protein Hcp [Gemmatimonadota bacterium]